MQKMQNRTANEIARISHPICDHLLSLAFQPSYWANALTNREFEEGSGKTCGTIQWCATVRFRTPPRVLMPEAGKST